MSYSIKECFYTLQGEGRQSGRAAVFCRFSGCNLWSGREQDRSTAVCRFCDTDFVGTDGKGGGKFASADALAQHIRQRWPASAPMFARPLVVCTGGEPALQLDKPLVDALHEAGFEVAIETNGTLQLADGIDWICVSPKADTELVVHQGHELKLVYPQAESRAEQFEGMSFRHFYLQPLDGPDIERNTRLCIDYCLDHPQWSLSLQTHKLIGIP
jgi:7-carboxy-7-deazaguanine synthase (Cx14CxxC type)